MNFTTDHQQQYLIQPMTGFVLIRTHQAGIVARLTDARCQNFVCYSEYSQQYKKAANQNTNLVPT